MRTTTSAGSSRQSCLLPLDTATEFRPWGTVGGKSPQSLGQVNTPLVHGSDGYSLAPEAQHVHALSCDGADTEAGRAARPLTCAAIASP